MIAKRHTKIVVLAIILLPVLVLLGALVNRVIEVRRTDAFREAVFRGDAARAAQLLDRGVDVNCSCQGSYPAYPAIYVAVQRNDAAMVKVLLDHHADPDFERDPGSGAVGYGWYVYPSCSLEVFKVFYAKYHKTDSESFLWGATEYNNIKEVIAD